MTAKALFQSNKELCAWWVGVSHDPRFDQVLMHVRAAAAQGQLPQAEMRGAEMMISTLEAISENEDSPTSFPSPGLIHQRAGEPLKPETAD